MKIVQPIKEADATTTLHEDFLSTNNKKTGNKSPIFEKLKHPSPWITTCSVISLTD